MMFGSCVFPRVLLRRLVPGAPILFLERALISIQFRPQSEDDEGTFHQFLFYVFGGRLLLHAKVKSLTNFVVLVFPPRFCRFYCLFLF